MHAECFATMSVIIIAGHNNSGADVYDRVSIFLESMYRDMYKGRCGQNAIIVSHGLFCRLFLTRFYHWPVSIVMDESKLYYGSLHTAYSNCADRFFP